MRPNFIKILTSDILNKSKYLFNFDKHNFDRCLILTYHRILPSCDDDPPYFRSSMTTSVDTFEKQLTFLKSDANVISLKKAIDVIQKGDNFEPRTIVITFDDGYIDNYAFAFPLLKKYSVPASIFLTTDPLDTGKPLWWDRIDGIVKYFHENSECSLTNNNSPFGKYIGDFHIIDYPELSNQIVDTINLLDKDKRKYFWEELGLWMETNSIPEPASPMMTWEMVREMSNNNITFECHTRSHAFLDELDRDGLKEELLGSRNRIRKMIGHDADILACPRGRMMSSEQMDFIKQEFNAVCTTETGFVDIDSDLFALNRKDAGYLSLDGCFNKNYFVAELNGYWDKVRSLKSKLFR